MKLLACLLLLASYTMMQEKPKEQPKPEGPKLPEVVKLRVMDSFKSLLLTQNRLKQAKEDACDATPACSAIRTQLVNQTTSVQAEYQKASKDPSVPEGATLQIVFAPDGSGVPADIIIVPQKKETK